MIHHGYVIVLDGSLDWVGGGQYYINVLNRKMKNHRILKMILIGARYT